MKSRKLSNIHTCFTLLFLINVSFLHAQDHEKFTYKPSLIVGYDNTTGALTGEVSTAYVNYGSDSSYAYHGSATLKSPTHRVKEVVQPGKGFKFSSENSITKAYQSTSAASFMTSAQVGIASGDVVKFHTQSNTSPTFGSQGHTVIEVHDLQGNVVAKKNGNKISTNDRNYLASEGGFMSTTKLPMWHENATANDNQKVISTVHDFIGGHNSVQRPDEGVRHSVQDNAGRTLFTVSSADEVSPQTSPAGYNRVTYLLYDTLSRVKEVGTIEISDIVTIESLKTNADYQTVPPGTKQWAYKYIYDDHFQSLTRVETYDIPNKVVVKEYEYDHARRLKKDKTYKGTIIDNVVTPSGSNSEFSYTYNNVSMITAITYPSSTTLHYEYDQYGRLSAIKKDASSTSSKLSGKYVYDIENRLLAYDISNYGIKKQYTYDFRGQLSHLDIVQITNSEGLFYQHMERLYNGKYQQGYIKSLTEYGKGLNYHTEEYDYDQYGQLTSVTDNSTSVGDYSYDLHGNLTSSSQTYNTGTNQVNQQDDYKNIKYNKLGKITEFAKSTDPSSPTKIDYDLVTEKPIKVENPNGEYIELKYSAGKRFEKISKSYAGAIQVSTTYLYGTSSQPLAEQKIETGVNDDLAITKEYFYSPHGELVAFGSDDQPGLKYLIQDYKGSTRQLTAVGTNTIQDIYNYTVWGEKTSDNTNGEVASINDHSQISYLYTGQEYDSEVELYNYKARQYLPELHRFLSPDPAHQGYSPYVYVGNNPVNFTDPTGKVSLIALESEAGISSFKLSRTMLRSPMRPSRALRISEYEKSIRNLAEISVEKNVYERYDLRSGITFPKPEARENFRLKVTGGKASFKEAAEPRHNYLDYQEAQFNDVNNGRFVFIIDPEPEFGIYAIGEETALRRRNMGTGPFVHHSSLISNHHWPILAGEGSLENGKLISLTNRSGHFLPDGEHFYKNAKYLFERKNIPIDSRYNTKMNLYGDNIIQDFLEDSKDIQHISLTPQEYRAKVWRRSMNVMPAAY